MQMMLLPPYHRNFGKLIRKSPKLHVIDPGLASWKHRASSPAGPTAPAHSAAGFARRRGISAWADRRQVRADAYATSTGARGFFSAIKSSVRAAPEGLRRPCSHSCRVRTDTPSSSANLDWEAPSSGECSRWRVR